MSDETRTTTAAEPRREVEPCPVCGRKEGLALLVKIDGDHRPRQVGCPLPCGVTGPVGDDPEAAMDGWDAMPRDRGLKVLGRTR